MRWLWGLAFGLFIIITPPLSRARADTQAPQEGDLTTIRLPNGLRVVVEENHHVPFVAVTVRYRVGTAMDPPGRSGLNELVMWLMSHRTVHVPENGFDAVIDRAGGSLGYSSTLDDTEFHARLPSNCLEKAFWLFSDQMGFFKPVVDATSIANRIARMDAERGQNVMNTPTGFLMTRMPAELFPESHPYHRATLSGDTRELVGVTPAEVNAFYDKWYSPKNAVVVVSGDVGRQSATELVTKYFGSLTGADAPAPLVSTFAGLRGETHLEIASRVERSLVHMEWVTPAHYAAGDAELDLVANILDGDRIARLTWELITRRRVAYGIRAYQRSRALASTFYIEATAATGHTAQEVADAIDDVLRILQSTSPSEDDMAGSLASVIGPQTLAMEKMDRRARNYASWALHRDSADYFQANIHRFAVDAAAVQAAARMYLPLDKRVVAFVQPSATAPFAGELLSRRYKASAAP